MPSKLIAHLLLIIDLRARDRIADERVGILTLPAVIQIPGHVVDTRTCIANLLDWRTNPARQHLGRALHRVAQPHQRDMRLVLDRPAQQHHGVGVVQHWCAGAVALHVARNIEHHRDCAQAAEDARWAARVANIGIDPICLWPVVLVR